MSGHTPGPWRVSKQHAGQYSGRAANVFGPEGQCIAAAWIWIAEDEPEARANAALIASAPEQQAKIEALETRVAALEKQIGAKASPGPHAAVVCDCGYTTVGPDRWVVDGHGPWTCEGAAIRVRP